MGEKLYIADKPTLDIVKNNTEKIMGGMGLGGQLEYITSKQAKTLQVAFLSDATFDDQFIVGSDRETINSYYEGFNYPYMQWLSETHFVNVSISGGSTYHIIALQLFKVTSSGIKLCFSCYVTPPTSSSPFIVHLTSSYLYYISFDKTYAFPYVETGTRYTTYTEITVGNKISYGDRVMGVVTSGSAIYYALYYDGEDYYRYTMCRINESSPGVLVHTVLKYTETEQIPAAFATSVPIAILDAVTPKILMKNGAILQPTNSSLAQTALTPLVLGFTGRKGTSFNLIKHNSKIYDCFYEDGVFVVSELNTSSLTFTFTKSFKIGLPNYVVTENKQGKVNLIFSKQLSGTTNGSVYHKLDVTSCFS